jgi:putative transposase
VGLVSDRRWAQWLIEVHGAPQRKACELVGLARSSFRYRSKRRDGELRAKLIELAQEKPRYGYRRLAVLLQREGLTVNHKRVWRVYRAAGLSVKRRLRKRLVRQGLQPMNEVKMSNQQWAIDFAHDVTASGRKFRVFSVVDAYSRECLALEVDTSFPSPQVTRVLDSIIAERGKTQSIRMDNGPELTSRHFLAWGVDQQIDLQHIAPGKPVQNAKVESFHGRLRDECLNVNWFANLWDARRKISAWRHEYNHERPHSSLGYLTPVEFHAANAARNSTNTEETMLPQELEIVR